LDDFLVSFFRELFISECDKFLECWLVQSLNWGLDRALDYYTQRPEWWQDLVKKAMLMDFSWDASAHQYVDLYKKVLSKVKV